MTLDQIPGWREAKGTAVANGGYLGLILVNTVFRPQD